MIQESPHSGRIGTKALRETPETVRFIRMSHRDSRHRASSTTPLFFNKMATLFDYLPADTHAIRVGALYQALEQFWTDVTTRYESLRYDRRKPIIPPERLFVRTEELFADLKAFGSIEIIEPDSTHARIRPLPDVTFNAKADEPAARIKALIENGQTVCFVAESAAAEALLELLAKHGIRPEPIERFSDFESSNRSAVITLGYWIKESWSINLRSFQKASYSAAACLNGEDGNNMKLRQILLSEISEIEIGDPIVHIDHGVGHYKGL